MDTVSRKQFYRKMEEVVEYLEYLNSTNKYEIYQFFRLISNGFSTEYNTRAMYTGSQLRQNRRGRPYWDFFSGQGNIAAYVNGFCEDWMSVFLKTKFKGMDHALFYPWCHFEFHPLEKTFGNFAGPFSIVRRCINGKYVHDYIFDYISDIWNNYSPYGKIIHVSFQEGHEGTGEVLRTLSPSMEKFLKLMEDKAELENTVLILTSDHGSHMGPYYMASDMGKFEQKLPLLLMIFPKKFLDKYPEFRKHLRENEQRLVSHYDIHWTLRHLATLPEFGGEIKENFKSEDWHEEVWDCDLNQKFMEVAWMFKKKLWRRGFKSIFTDEIYNRIEICFNETGVTPDTHDNVTTVPLSEIIERSEDTGSYVTDVIKDIDSMYWFEDAYQYISKGSLVNSESFGNYKEFIQNNLEAEENSWTTLKAPGKARYLFGRSLLKYHDDQDCPTAGILNCACSEKNPVFELHSSLG